LVGMVFKTNAKPGDWSPSRSFRPVLGPDKKRRRAFATEISGRELRPNKKTSPRAGHFRGPGKPDPKRKAGESLGDLPAPKRGPLEFAEGGDGPPERGKEGGAGVSLGIYKRFQRSYEPIGPETATHRTGGPGPFSCSPGAKKKKKKTRGLYFSFGLPAIS